MLRAGRLDELIPEEEAEFDFLESRGFLERIPHDELDRIFASDAWMLDSLYGPENVDDYISRRLAARMNAGSQNDSVGICLHPFPRPDQMTAPKALQHLLSTNAQPTRMETTLRVAVDGFPLPGETCSWEDILDFKTEVRDAEWRFQRFLQSLATKQQTEADIREDIEATLKEYRAAMNRQR